MKILFNVYIAAFVYYHDILFLKNIHHLIWHYTVRSNIAQMYCMYIDNNKIMICNNLTTHNILIVKNKKTANSPKRFCNTGCDRKLYTENPKEYNKT